MNDSSSSSPPAFSSLEDLTAHLEQLAAELGIDTSDIDETAPLPPEFLALFPPDIAAFLADPPEPHESPPVREPARQPDPARSQPPINAPSAHETVPVGCANG